MFTEMNKYLLFLNHTSLHNFQAQLSASNGVDMLQWMHDEFIQAVDAYDWSNWEMGVSDEKALPLRQKAHALTLSYISMACNVEGVVSQLYKDIIRISNSSFNGRKFFTTPATDDVQGKNDRAGEVVHIRMFRNKLSAHTSYALPTHAGRTDSHSTQHTSVWLLQPGTFSPEHPKTYGIGGSAIMVGNETENVFSSIHFSLNTDHHKVLEHFGKWEQMIITALQQLGQQCPIYTPDFRLLRKSDPWEQPTPVP